MKPLYFKKEEEKKPLSFSNLRRPQTNGRHQQAIASMVAIALVCPAWPTFVPLVRPSQLSQVGKAVSAAGVGPPPVCQAREAEAGCGMQQAHWLPHWAATGKRLPQIL